MTRSWSTAHVAPPSLHVAEGLRAAGGGGSMVLQGPASGLPLDCAVERLPDAALVRVRGEVDLLTAPILRRCLDEAARHDEPVLLDLTAVEYLDASGIHVLEGFHARHTGRFVIAGSRRPVHRVLEIVKLHEVVPMFPTVELALEYIRAHG